MKAIRAKVSGSRVRYMKEGFDLDLTYISPSLIAMGYPASGMEKTYRNDISEVAAFLDSRHANKYRVYNLSERKYDYGKFHNRVNECGFPDHHPPPLQLLLDIINDMLKWTAQADDNVVVVHCLAGKGRTGVVCSCFLLLTGLYGNLFAIRNDRELRQLANTAIRDFWNARGQGVRYPSQALYIYYFLRVVRRLRKMPREIPRLRPAKKMLLKQVVMNGIPNYEAQQGGGCTPFLQVLPAPSQHEKPALLYNSSWQNPNFDSYAADPNGSIVFDANCVIQGDIVIRGFHANANSILGRHVVQMFHVTFNTDFFRKNCDLLRLRKKEVDEAHDNARFPESFCLDCYIEPVVEDDDYYPEDDHYDEDVEVLNSDRIFQLDQELSSSAPRISSDPLSAVRRSAVSSNGNSDDQSRRSSQLRLEPGNGEDQSRRSSQLRREPSFQPKPETSKMGWLYKQGGFVKSWKKRWFVARDGQLMYFEKASDPTPLGVVDLRGVHVDTAFAEETTARNKYLHYFKVIPRKRDERTWYFGADSETEMAKWLRVLSTQSCFGMEPTQQFANASLPHRNRSTTTTTYRHSDMSHPAGQPHQRSITFNDQHHQPEQSLRHSESRVSSMQRPVASSMIDFSASASSNYAQRGSFGGPGFIARSPPPNMKTHQVARVNTSNDNDAFFAQSLDSSRHEVRQGRPQLLQPRSQPSTVEVDDDDDEVDDYTPFLSSAHAPPAFTKSQPVGSMGSRLLLSDLDRQTVLQEVSSGDFKIGMYIYTADELQTASRMQQYVLQTMMEAGGSGMYMPIADVVKQAIAMHEFEYAERVLAEIVVMHFPTLVDAMECNPAMFVDTICGGSTIKTGPQGITSPPGSSRRGSRRFAETEF